MVDSKDTEHFFPSLLRDAATRTGVFVGISLSLIFAVWLFVANRVPLLDGVSLQRNVTAALLLGVFGSVPLLRFFRSPSELLLSSIIGWSLFTLTYGALGFKFGMLDQYYSTSQVFALGMVVYLLFATLSWIGTIIWRVRATDSSHPRQ